MPMMVLVAGLFPLGCLGLLLWLGRLEDTLGDDVRRTGRGAEPPPVVSVPVRGEAAPPVPRQRTQHPAPAASDRDPRVAPAGELVVEGPEAVA